MNVDGGALDFTASINNEQLHRTAREAEDRIKGITRTVADESKKMDDSFANIGKMVGGYFGIQAMTGFLKELVNVRGEFQQLDVAFTTMLGSKEKADKLMAQIVDTAAKTPFTLSQVAGGTKRLLAYQVAADEVNDTVIRLGNIASGVSVPLDRLILVYGQVKAKGKIMGDDLRQFSEAGIPMIHELAKAMGVADSEISKMVEAGRIGFPQVQKVIRNLTDEGGMFFNLMEKQSQTITGQLSNLQDAWARMLNKIGESNENLISSVITGATDAVNHYDEIGNILAGLVASYGAYKAIVMLTAASNNAAYMTESAALEALLSAEQLEALAKDKMSMSSLQYNAAIRQEIAANVTNLEATLANLTAQEQVAKSEYRLALQRSLSSKALVSQRQMELSLAKLGGQQAQIELAEKSLLEAQEERHIAVKARKAQADAYAIAQSRTKSAATAIETVTGDVNAASTATQSVATNFLTTAKIQLTAAVQRLNVALMENPWALIAAAIALAVYGIYKFVTYSTEAEKAQRELNTAIEGETLTLDIMFERLKNAEKGTKDYAEAKKAIVDKYGQYDSMLASELESVDGITIAYDKLRTAVLEAAKARLREKYTKDASDKAAEEIGDSYTSIRKLLQKEIGKDAGNALFASVRSAFENGGDWKKILNDNKIFTEDIVTTTQWGTNVYYNPIVKEFNKIRREKEKLTNDLQELNQVFGEIQTKSDNGKGDDGKKLKTIQEQIKDNLSAQKEAEDRLKSMRSAQSTFTAEDIDEQEKKVKALKEQYQTLTGIDLKKAEKDNNKDKNDEEKNLQDYEEEKLRIKKKAADSAIELEKAGVTDKKKLIDIDLKQTMAGIDEMESVYKEKAAKAKDTNPDLSIFDAMRKAATDTAKTDKDAIDAEERKKHLDDLLSKYKDYEQTLLEIQKKYSEDSMDLEVSLANAKTDEERQQIERTKAERDKAFSKDKAQAEVDKIMKSTDWTTLFGNLETTSVDKIREIRDKLEGEFAKLNLPPDQLKAVRDQLDKATEEIQKRNPFAALSDAIKKYKQDQNSVNLKGIAKSAAATADMIKGTFDSAVGALDKMGIQTDDQTKQVLNDISGMIGGAGKLAEGIATGNPLQIIQGSIELISNGIDLIAGAKDRKLERSIASHEEQVKKLKTAYDQLSRAVDLALGSDRYSAQKATIDNLKQQQYEYAQMVRDEQDKKKTDAGKVDEYNQAITDNFNKIQDTIKSIREDILTTSVESAANDLGKSLLDAFAAGENAAEAFGKKVDEVVGNVIRKMLIQKLVEQPVGDIINRYMSQWVDSSGNFLGFDSVMQSAQAMGKELTALGPGLSNVLSSLPDDVKKYLVGSDGTSKTGLSGAIQGMSEDTASVLSGYANAIRINQIDAIAVMRDQLSALTRIEANTALLRSIDNRLANMNSDNRANGLGG